MWKWYKWNMHWWQNWRMQLSFQWRWFFPKLHWRIWWLWRVRIRYQRVFHGLSCLVTPRGFFCTVCWWKVFRFPDCHVCQPWRCFQWRCQTWSEISSRKRPQRVVHKWFICLGENSSKILWWLYRCFNTVLRRHVGWTKSSLLLKTQYTM